MAGSPLAVLASGLVSGVGLASDESCAAIRCGINNFQSTRFIGMHGDWLVGSPVTLETPRSGLTRLAKMAALSVGECFAAAADKPPDHTPILLCVAEKGRPGRDPLLNDFLLNEIGYELAARLHPHSRLIDMGRVGGAVALLEARHMLTERRSEKVIVAGVDSFLVDHTIEAFDLKDRLLRPGNSNGFIPGEAAAAVLLEVWQEDVPTPLLLTGLGFGREPAPFCSRLPLRAQGLMEAISLALADARVAMADCDFRISDSSGEQHRFKEEALAITRLLRDRKVLFSLTHLGDCVGEVGAATLPAMLAVLAHGAAHDYLPGPTVLGHLSNDDDKRAAFVAHATAPQTLALEIAAEAAFALRRIEAS
jgi:3-oxoacyl-[acyl-carrier-protein] synthase-1